MRGALTSAAIAIALAALALSATSSPVAGQEAVTVSIDVDSAGNQPTSLGTRQDCITINSGDTLVIDITVDSIAAWSDGNGNTIPDSGDTGGLAAFQFVLNYDPDVLRVTAINNAMLIAANQITPIDLSESVPDSDGQFSVGLSDFSTTSPEDGSGVLSRITVTAMGSGQSELQLLQAAILDPANNGYVLAPVQPAAIAVGQACTAPSPVTPTLAGQDSDGDGLSDADEQRLGTDPNGPDSDGDGISDGQEVNVLGSDPLAPGAEGGTPAAAPVPRAQEPTSLSVDVIPTDNTPTSIVQIDSCASAKEDDTFDVDLIIENVTDLLAWELIISYDPEVLEIQDEDATLFQGDNPRSDVMDLSEQTPDSDGRYLLQSFDAADPDSPDSGSGVLARLTLKAMGPGISPLTIDKLDLDGDGTPDQGPLLRNVAGDIIGDDDGDTLFDGPVSNAEIRVGEACQGAAMGVTVLTSDDDGISLALLIGAIVGGVAALALALAAAVFLLRRRAART